MQTMLKLLSLTLAALSITSSTTQKPKARKLLGDDALDWTLVNTDVHNGFKYYTHANGDHYVFYGQGNVAHDIYSKGQVYRYNAECPRSGLSTLKEPSKRYYKLPLAFTSFMFKRFGCDYYNDDEGNQYRFYGNQYDVYTPDGFVGSYHTDGAILKQPAKYFTDTDVQNIHDNVDAMRQVQETDVEIQSSLFRTHRHNAHMPGLERFYQATDTEATDRDIAHKISALPHYHRIKLEEILQKELNNMQRQNFANKAGVFSARMLVKMYFGNVYEIISNSCAPEGWKTDDEAFRKICHQSIVFARHVGVQGPWRLLSEKWKWIDYIKFISKQYYKKSLMKRCIDDEYWTEVKDKDGLKRLIDKSRK